jgi:hypothetical protein
MVTRLSENFEHHVTAEFHPSGAIDYSCPCGYHVREHKDGRWQMMDDGQEEWIHFRPRPNWRDEVAMLEAEQAK